MKFIRKNGTPYELRSWYEGQPVENGERINCRYADIPGPVKQVVRQSLLAEQGYLCCYTGRSIDEKSCHIEHLKPQALCSNGEDIEYSNLLAAFPATGAEAPYGAKAKQDWYDETQFVTPLQETCESRFKFNSLGKMTSKSPTDSAAIETIRRLHLDHDELNDHRRQVINVVLINSKPSKKKLETIHSGYCQLNGLRRFNSYCFVIQQVAGELLEKAEKRRKSKLHTAKASKAKRKSR